MKKYFEIFTAVFALTAISFSCQKAEIAEPDTQDTPKGEKVETVLTATLEPRTKITLNFPHLSWDDEDEIAVFSGNGAPDKFVCEVVASDDEAAESAQDLVQFSGETEAADKLYAVYPYNESATYADGKITTTIPHEQVIPEGGNIDKSALLCVASTTDNNLAFKNVIGLVKVTVPADMKINRIALRGKDGETLAGTGTIEVTDKPIFEATTATADNITLTYAGGEVFPAGEYYLAVAPVDFKNGFTISFTKVDGKTALKEASQSNTVVRNGGLDTKNLLTTLSWVYEITSKADLLSWGANWGRYDHVILANDINMENESWTPVGNGSGTFNGVFDGNGKKIYNLKVNTDGYAGFIGHLAGSGCVKDLIIGSQDGTSYDGSSAIVHTPSKDETGWSYVGVVAKLGGSATVTGVTNYAELRIPESEYKVMACMGGVVAIHQGTGRISECTNAGAINFMAATGSTGANVIGGIVSKTDYATTIEECRNSGTITNKNAGVQYIGGIIGNTHSRSEDDYAVNLTSNTNTGMIDVQAIKTGTDIESAAGGICGLISGSTLTTCTNTGVISVTAGSMVHVGGIAGMYRLSYGAKLDRCINGTENMTESLFDYRATGGQTRLGGVLGHCHNSTGRLELVGCYNHSPISVSISGLRQVGGICSAVAAGVELSVNNCHNTGKITLGNVASNHDSSKQFGGLFGYLKSQSGKVFEIMNSTNSGDIETFVSAGGETQIAGISGYVEAYVTISNCTNSGNVSAKGAATKPRLGGIVGVTKGADAKFLACVNNGTIANESSNGNVYVGGIAGYANAVVIGTDADKGCVNNGNVTVTAAGGDAAAGGVVGQALAGTKVEDAKNTATVQWTATTGGMAYVGGLVGWTNASTIQGTGEKTCSNNGLVSVTNTIADKNPYIGGITGFVNGASTVSKCYNDGDVSITGSGAAPSVGGIVGYMNSTAKVSGCYNQSNVNATGATGECSLGGLVGQAKSGTIEKSYNQQKVSFSANVKPMVGGLVGHVAGAVTIDDCHNDTAGIVECTKAGGTVCLGGLVGRCSVEGMLINNSSNSCAVSATVTNQSLIVGGLVGVVEWGSAGGACTEFNTCTNRGKITVTPGGKTYARVGGIAAFIAKAHDAVINTCTNDADGEIYVNGSTTSYVYAGGIVGYSSPNVGYSGNTNKAKIGGTSKGDYYVGGIWGYDDVLAEGYTARDVSGNKNFGELYGTTASGKTHSVGGLFGRIINVAVANIKSDNTNYGNVTCAGGALAGTSNVTWSGLVGTAVTVNGAVGAAGTPETAWLCPAGTGTVTATYVGAIE